MNEKEVSSILLQVSVSRREAEIVSMVRFILLPITLPHSVAGIIPCLWIIFMKQRVDSYAGM